MYPGYTSVWRHQAHVSLRSGLRYAARVVVDDDCGGDVEQQILNGPDSDLNLKVPCGGTDSPLKVLSQSSRSHLTERKKVACPSGYDKATLADKLKCG